MKSAAAPTFVSLRLLPVLSILALSACQNEYLTTSESDVVVTFRDEGRDYSKYKTYLLPESVVDLCEAQSGGAGIGGASGTTSASDNCKPADHSLDSELLAALRENMDALGYRAIENPAVETPDLAFFVGIIAEDNWYVSSSPGYCYPYYYYWGCWYSSYTYAYNLPTNAYVIDLADTAESADGTLQTVWTAALQGLQRSASDKTGAQRIAQAVNQAFSQSSYLAEGGE